MRFRLSFRYPLALVALAIGAAGFTGCAGSQPPAATGPTLTHVSTAPGGSVDAVETFAPSVVPASATPASPEPTASATITLTPHLQLCSPIQHIPLERMGEIVQGKMETPHPGQDDGHHGVDFAFYRFDDLNGIEGLEIYSVLNGVVAGSFVDRNPYGNFVIIETPLEQLPAGWLSTLAMPTPSPAMPLDPRMAACPAELPAVPSGTGRSLYLLYGHFQAPSSLRMDDPVACGQTLGQAGNTGMSGNPHLHLEARVGPSGARFPAMNYYDNGATSEELGNYCLWRASQIFQLIDPLKLLGIE